MSTHFEATVDIDRPIEEVFAHLADGRHDPEFSPRVLAIRENPERPDPCRHRFPQHRQRRGHDHPA